MINCDISKYSHGRHIFTNTMYRFSVTSQPKGGGLLWKIDTYTRVNIARLYPLWESFERVNLCNINFASECTIFYKKIPI